MFFQNGRILSLMSFFAHLMKDERIAALHIAEDAVSVLSFTRASKELPHARITRIPLPEGTIVKGRVVDLTALTRALRDLRIQSKAYHHVIVAIPHPAIFTKAVVFPPSLDAAGETSRAVEAANLALEWNVPFAPETRYADIDMLQEPVRGMQIHAIPIEDATPYLSAVMRAGFKPVALESELDAVARAVDPGQNVITTFPSHSYENMLACFGGFAIFQNTYAHDAFPTKTARAAEQKRIAEFVAARFGKRPTAKLFEKLPLLDEVQGVIASRNDTSLIPLLGAALRARLPRKNDIAASLLPVGTEEAYEYQKLETFIGSLGTLTLVTALIIASASVAAWYGVRTELATLPQSDIFTETFAADATFTEERADYERWSTVIATVGPLATEETSFARMTTFLRRYAIAGIALRDIAADGATVRVAGMARSRTHLNAFRDTLRAAPEVAAVDLPITDAELRGDIPFQMTITFTPQVWKSWTGALQ